MVSDSFHSTYIKQVSEVSLIDYYAERLILIFEKNVNKLSFRNG